jgi:glyoxylase-like metal-dependent hydrolase (beta-lactamase superfamily II)
MQIDCLTLGPIQANSYLIRKEGLKESILIDPGADPQRIVSFVREQDAVPSVILLTHGHADHVSAASRISTELEITVAMHEYDLSWAFDQDNTIDSLYPPPGTPFETLPFIGERDSRANAGLFYDVILTPGHTAGSVCYYFPDQNALFSGDTVFAGSVGRTDLPGSNPKAMQESLRVIASLPDDTAIYPGHGNSTTLRAERQTNYFFQRL